MRPKVAEIVAHLGRAVADLGGLIPPCAQAENVAVNSEGPMPLSNFMEHRRVRNLIPT